MINIRFYLRIYFEVYTGGGNWHAVAI